MRKELWVIHGKYDLEAVIEEVPSKHGGFPVISLRREYLDNNDEKRYAYEGFSAGASVQKELRRLLLEAYRWAKQYRQMKEAHVPVMSQDDDDDIVW